MVVLVGSDVVGLHVAGGRLAGPPAMGALRLFSAVGLEYLVGRLLGR